MVKRIFDILVALMLLILLSPILLGCLFITAFDTKSSGIFLQDRIGQYGKPFLIYKLRSVQTNTLKISKWGSFIRSYKLDEFPQLVNILKGEMTFVGPRPDVPGYYDLLVGEDRKVLLLKPGLTSKATIKYANEEAVLMSKENPLHFNDTVIFPDKVKLNLAYYYNHSFLGDLKILWKTILVVLK